MELFYTPGLTTNQQLELNRVHRRIQFWDDVCISDDKNCWLYCGTMYGGQLARTIREVIWKLELGKEIPFGHAVRHSCNNSKCCNPNHLHLYKGDASIR